MYTIINKSLEKVDKNKNCEDIGQYLTKKAPKVLNRTDLIFRRIFITPTSSANSNT
jgi:hypothetical protein